MKVTSLNEESLTPSFVLNEVMSFADKIESLVIVYRYKDGVFESAASKMPDEHLATLSLVLHRRALNIWGELDAED